MIKESGNNSIKFWPKDERPREKLFKSGEHTLTNTELLAILLRSGTKGQSAVDLSRKILSKFGTFRDMSHTDIRDWKEFKGLGQAKIAQIKAALEIARRFNNQTDQNRKTPLKTTEDVVELFKSRLRYLKNEIVKIILCDVKNRIIEVVEITQGTPTESCPMVREIISKALQGFAPGIICIHNHPLGDPLPSKDDEIFTKSLKEAAVLMGINLLDHIIFGEESFYSFEKRATASY